MIRSACSLAAITAWFALGCGPGQSSAPPSTAPAPVSTHAAIVAPAPRATPFGEVRTRRVLAAHASLAPALREWQLEELGTSCTLVFDEHDEWLVGCPMTEPPTGFEPTGEQLESAPVLWNPDPLTLGTSITPYERVATSVVGTVAVQRNETTGAESPVLVLHEWDALHAHHPAFADSGIEEWLGITVHEAFHAHQMWHPRVRALIGGMKDGAASTDELAAFYRSNLDYQEAVDREIGALRAATDSARNEKSAKAALSKWVTAREARRAAFEGKLEAALPRKRAWDMDGFYTFLEGTARYTEARFLMNPPAETRAALQPEATYSSFVQTLGKSPSQLPGLSKGGPKYVYAMGMYLSFLLDVAQPDWKQHVFDDDGLLVALVERVAKRPRH